MPLHGLTTKDPVIAFLACADVACDMRTESSRVFSFLRFDYSDPQEEACADAACEARTESSRTAALIRKKGRAWEGVGASVRG